jgi:HCOMODA/2-hydroxy-3-carboxy-muconic semialdehyde decarboxylase
MAASASRSAGPVAPGDIENLVAANRILAAQGVLDAFGHVSIRHPTGADRYLLSRNLAPELVTAADIVEYDLDSEPVAANAPKGFLERYIHGEIYRRRPDVMAVVHTHSPTVVPFGITTHPLRPVYHMSAFLWRGVPVFDIARESGRATDILIREPGLGRMLANVLGDRPAALMRGHGNVVVGPALQTAVFRAVYAEINARLQLQAMTLGGPITFLDPQEAMLAEVSIDSQIERPWQLWKQKALKEMLGDEARP